jgi:hypothetical protein
MTERNYSAEIDELAQKIYGLFRDSADDKLLINLSYLCGIALGTMSSMEKEIMAHRMLLAEKGEENG